MHVLIVGESGVKADDSLLTEAYGLHTEVSWGDRQTRMISLDIYLKKCQQSWLQQVMLILCYIHN